MYMIFNNFKKGWSLGLLYDNPAVPEHLKIMLCNNENMRVRDLARWLSLHNVRGIAYCVGNWKDKVTSHRFINQFNRHMEKLGVLAELGDLYREVMAAEERAEKKERMP